MIRQALARPKDAIHPRIESGPINICILFALFFAWLCRTIWPYDPAADLQLFYALLMGVCAAVFAAQALKLLRRDYRLRRDLALSERVSADHGAARQATFAERRARGMSDQSSGELLGLDDEGRPVYRPASAPFALIEMPPGVGKTVSLVIGSILHRAMHNYSVVVPDVKNELAVMLAGALMRLGIEVWFCNPSRNHMARAGDTPLNPYQPLIDAVHGDDEARKDAVKYAADYAAIHHPMSSEEKNPYFVNGARRAMMLGMLSQALLDPAQCTPTALYTLITDPARFLARCNTVMALERTPPFETIVDALKTEAANLLHRADKNEENFAAFLEGASQRLISFNPAGHLGHYGAGAIHNLAALRQRPIVLFIMTPLSHMREFADFISLLNHNIIAVCKAKPDGHPIHIVGEEALNYRFHDLVSDLETVRQLGVSADFYIQSFAGLERHYGKDAAAAIESYADVRIYGGLNSLARLIHPVGVMGWRA